MPAVIQCSEQLNLQFAVDFEEATTMWSEAPSTQKGGHGIHDDRRSIDGNWLIRQRHVLTTGDIVPVKQELRRLQSLGIDVISFAYAYQEASNEDETPANGSWTDVYGVTPWINDIEPCREETYTQHIAPRLLQYFERIRLLLASGRPLEPFLDCVAGIGQYSELGGNGVSFMHDIDPCVMTVDFGRHVYRDTLESSIECVNEISEN
jgi:hypothetical protein